MKSARASSRTDYRVSGVRGLQLRVTAAGTKTWVLAFKQPSTGRWVKKLIGHYPTIGLAQARQLGQQLAGKLAAGEDPLATNHNRKPLSFSDLADQYLSEHAKKNMRGGTVSRTTTEAQRILRRDVLRHIGHLDAKDITRRQISVIVEQVADRGAFVSADRALGVMRAIYNWGISTGRLDTDPTVGLRKRNSSKPRTRVLEFDEIRKFWKLTSGSNSGLQLALRLQLLTGTRISEVLGARRCEFNIDNKLWTIPATRTKSAREHAIPLTALAIDVLRQVFAQSPLAFTREARPIGDRKEELIFISSRARSRKMTDGGFDAHGATKFLLRLRPQLTEEGISEPFNTHDLRRTFATKLSELGVNDDTIAHLLNHAPMTVTRRHYNHARKLEEKRAALELWSTTIIDRISK